MTFVADLAAAEIDSLRRALDGGAFEFKDVAHAVFSARGEGVSCTAYRSGKVVVQGKGAEQFTAHYLPGHDRPAPAAAEEEALLEFDHTVVGSDETGKGDYFGPLVTAAVAFGPQDAKVLEETRIADSKKLTQAVIRAAAPIIREALPHAIVVVGPQRYNELYAKFRNLNALLAWSHATAIEEVLEKCDAETVVVDRFCEEAFLRRYLKPRTLEKNLVVRPRAESNHAVAAASIIASDTFTRQLAKLGREVDLTLPKGASAAVDAAARRLVRVQGPEVLRRVAKLHFRTTDRVLEG